MRPVHGQAWALSVAAQAAYTRARVRSMRDGAATAAAGVSGVRARLAKGGYLWLSPRRLRFATAGLVVVGLIGASVGVSAT
jgi:hypothetical protein